MKKELFDSNSFAVIGASRDPGKVGHIIFRNLINNLIIAYPINPNATEILGRKSYKSIIELDQKVDCAIIAVPFEFVLKTLKEVAKKKINNVIIISSGFLEAGNEKLNDEIKKIIKENKMNLLGPNTMGYINPYLNINTTFFEGIPKPGKTAFISQSGAIGSAILDRNFKLSGFVSVGNLVNLDFSYFIDYFNLDNNTEVINLYIESLNEGMGKKFIESAKNSKKPIIALKSGKTLVGSKAANSHTAALATPEGVFEGIFKQSGIIEANSIKELFLISETLLKIKGSIKNACVVTNAGGPGVLATDYLIKNNINIPEIPNKIKEELNKILPAGWSHNNPVDILGDSKAQIYEKTLEVLEKEDFFDFFIVILTPQYMTEPYKTSQVLLKIKNKPIIACYLGGEKVKLGANILNEKVMVFDELKEMAEVLGKLVKKEK